MAKVCPIIVNNLEECCKGEREKGGGGVTYRCNFSVLGKTEYKKRDWMEDCAIVQV